jgi:hypothetical protein
VSLLSTAQLRAQLKAASAADQHGSDLPAGSVYLYALGCAFLGGPAEDDAVTQALYELFERQAAIEGVDGDAAIEALAMIEAPS